MSLTISITLALLRLYDLALSPTDVAVETVIAFSRLSREVSPFTPYKKFYYKALF